MSRNTKNNMTKNTTKKPFCKVCQDAGKPESEYTSHWVKDLNGNTVCKTLLATECRYCFKLGHTAKFCSILEKNKKEKERAERRATMSTREESVQKDKKLSPEKFLGGFAALQYESDSEDEEKMVPQVMETKNYAVEEFPALGSTVKKVDVIVQPDVKNGWAAIAAKPKTEEKKTQEIKAVFRDDRDFSKPIYTKSWADWSDSEDEEDEDITQNNTYAADDDDDW